MLFERPVHQIALENTRIKSVSSDGKVVTNMPFESIHFSSLMQIYRTRTNTHHHQSDLMWQTNEVGWLTFLQMCRATALKHTPLITWDARPFIWWTTTKNEWTTCRLMVLLTPSLQKICRQHLSISCVSWLSLDQKELNVVFHSSVVRFYLIVNFSSLHSQCIY